MSVSHDRDTLVRDDSTPPVVQWRDRAKRVVRASALGQILASFGESQVISGTAAARNTISRIARHSALLRWLTSEPDPEMIVIDLRETRTVGPVIQLLDWGITCIQPYWEGTVFKRGIDGVVALSERTADTRVGMMLGRLFTPPEPPDDETRENS